MYEIYAPDDNASEEEFHAAWTRMWSSERESDRQWQGDNDPLLRALVD